MSQAQQPEALHWPAWQPIAAAPKSGRTLMLGFFNESGKWRTTRGQWFTQEHIDGTWEDADDCKAGWYETPVVGEDCYPVAPTHWMPLPTAPGSTPSTAAPASPAAGAAQAVEPFGYVNTNTGQFFKNVDQCRKGNEGHWRTVYAAPQAAATPAADFQQRVLPWMMACFGPAISADVSERNHRFLEEALELVQACGCTASEARQLVDYVYGRPLGEKHQEVGGVMVTLAALCLAQGLDMHAAGDTELARIWTKVDAIRAKQAAKPKHSPLPAAQEGQDARQWLQVGDMEALARFAETTDDDQSYDIGKEAVKRLAHFGCVESHGFGRYGITAFGSYVLGDWSRARELPFKTQADRDAEHRAAIAAQAAQGGA